MVNNVDVVNVGQKLSLFNDLWSPKIITELNDNYVKLAKIQGEFIWHKHDDDDELFFVISGDLNIELRDKVLELQPGELVVIPKGVEHRPVAKTEVSIMLIETKATINTGDATDTQDIKPTIGSWI
jgi:mannose-6-phosphate isomerase-like protein (cupin superfamily)